MTTPLVEVKNLKKYFKVSGGSFQNPRFVKAVDDVSFSIYKGETLGPWANRMRQVHDGPHHAAPVRADGGRILLDGRTSPRET
jgi:ABC-type antimicrobial peptide transport system ATPase subunit